MIKYEWSEDLTELATIIETCQKTAASEQYFNNLAMTPLERSSMISISKNIYTSLHYELTFY